MSMMSGRQKSVHSNPMAGYRGMANVFIGLQVLACCLAGPSFNAHAASLSITDVHALFMQKDYAKAREAAEQLAGQTQNFYERSEAYYYAGLSELWQGRQAQARQWIQKALKGPASTSLQDMAELAMIDTYFMEGEYQKSLRQSQNFLDTHPKSEFISSAYLKLARSNLKLANWKQGREILQKIVQKFPGSLERFYVEQLLAESQFFAVQVGSFQDRVMAEGLVDQLKNKGEYAYIVETTSQEGKKFFRVRVGQFQQFDEAQKLEVKLAKLGYPTKIYP